jgi:C-terminal processing protease CtpA/Prc
MNKTIVSLLLCSVSSLLACEGGRSTGEVTSQEVAALALPEPAAAQDDYQARQVTFRLFGTQGEGNEAFATLSELPNFETRDVAVGGTVGRNLRLSGVLDQQIVLEDTTTGQRRTVRSGEDFAVRVIEHAYDQAVKEQASHTYTVRKEALARLSVRYGVGAGCEEVSFAGRTFCRITRVDRSSVAARLDLKVGDLLLDANGQTVTSQNIEQALRSLSESKSEAFPLTLARHGVLLNRLYLSE